MKEKKKKKHMKEKKEREVDDNRSWKKNLSTGDEKTTAAQLCGDYNNAPLQKLQQRSSAKTGSRAPAAPARPHNLSYLLLSRVCPTTLDTYLLPTGCPTTLNTCLLPTVCPTTLDTCSLPAPVPNFLVTLSFAHA
jgi:hypothetical protein